MSPVFYCHHEEKTLSTMSATKNMTEQIHELAEQRNTTPEQQATQLSRKYMVDIPV